MEMAKIGTLTTMPNLSDLIKELVIIEEQKKRQRKQERELERIYEEVAEPVEKIKEKPYKIEISLE